MHFYPKYNVEEVQLVTGKPEQTTIASVANEKS